MSIWIVGSKNVLELLINALVYFNPDNFSKIGLHHRPPHRHPPKETNMRRGAGARLRPAEENPAFPDVAALKYQ